MKDKLSQMLKQKKGVIVNMASILVKVSFTTSLHYVVTKQGVIGVSKTTAPDYAIEGIRNNAICHGFIDTSLLSNVGITSHFDIKLEINDKGLPFKITQFCSDICYLKTCLSRVFKSTT